MQTPIESGRPRLPHDRAVAVFLAALTLTGCDSFFEIQGRVTDCGTNAGLAGADVDVHVDRGYQDRMESFPNETMTDARGDYFVGLNDPSESWVTLTFHRDGYLSFTAAQFKGHGHSDPAYDLCLTQAPPPP